MGHTASEAWAMRVERWRQSGLTAVQFAAREGINPHTLAYWKWKLRQRAQRPRRRQGKPDGTVRPTDFVELVAPQLDVAVPTPAWELVLARGYRVRITDGFAADTLRRLLDVLEARR